jgi:hypothetical protein
MTPEARSTSRLRPVTSGSAASLTLLTASDRRLTDSLYRTPHRTPHRTEGSQR